MKIIKSSLFYIILLGITILFTFWKLPQTFYQQDEWLGVGQVFSLGWGIITKDNSLIQLIFADGRPLSRALGAFYYQLFPFQALPIAIYSITFHFLNTILVYFIINRLVKNRFTSFLGALYFAVASVSHQAVTWFGAAFGAQPSSFFIFSSILLFLIFLENKKSLFLYFSFLSLTVSLYFKETGVFLFPIFIITPLILNKKIKVSKGMIPPLLFILIFILYRLIEMLFIRTPSEAKVYATAASQNFISVILARLLLYPLTSFSLSFIPVPAGLSMASNLWKLYYPFIQQRPDLVFSTVILDLIAVIFTGFLLLILYLISKTKEYRNLIIFPLALFILSVTPYVVIAKSFSYLEPRYYYIPVLASSLIITIILNFLINFLKGSKKTIFLCAIILIYLIYIRYNISVVHSDINYQVDLANERKSFMAQLYGYLPTLKENTNIFYFTGNKSWLVEGNKTPFQNGFGYTLMVLYYKTGKIPKYLPASEYLWMLGDQGFKKIDNLTYGYFDDLTTLKKEVKNNSFDPRAIHSFYYDRQTKKLSDITIETQEELTKP